MDSTNNPQNVSQPHKKVERTEESPQLLQVASSSLPSSVAGAIAGMIREKGFCELQAIGAGAVNQSVKAIAIARGYMAPSGVDLVCVPAFVDVKINGEDRTAIKFVIEPRQQRTH
ncbi:MAG: stage V sporulation protein S [Candidatus Sericytochromatia bacterium]|nr:stage V sporulation protein S [Candidatus Sericytochromatia bacterium]